MMAQQPDTEDKKDDDIKEETSLSKLKQQFKVDAVKFEYDNNEDSKCIHLTFVDKTSENKYQIYEKIFTVRDCTQIKKEIGFGGMQINDFICLIMDSLSCEDKSYSVEFQVIHARVLKLNIVHSPSKYMNIKFSLNIPAKKMKESDLLKLRLKEAEDKITELTAKLSEKTWKQIAVQNPSSTTDSTTHNTQNYLVSVTLPKKAGRYLCQFSFSAQASKHWIYWWFKQDTQNIANKGLGGTHTINGGYTQISQMAIVNLNGNENEQERTIRVYATGHASYPAIFNNCVLVCEEL
eukprot:314033_1